MSSFRGFECGKRRSVADFLRSSTGVRTDHILGPWERTETQDIVQDQHRRSLLTSNSEDGRVYALRPEMIIQSGISSPSLTRRVRCVFQNELLTSQLSRRCCAARALMIRLLLNLLTRMFRNSACFSADITWSGLGENHSLGGVFVHRGLVSASINNLCREFLGVGERNEWTVRPPGLTTRMHSDRNMDSS